MPPPKSQLPSGGSGLHGKEAAPALDEIVPPTIGITLDAQHDQGLWKQVPVAIGFARGRSRVLESVLQQLDIQPKTISRQRNRNPEAESSLEDYNVIGSVDLTVRRPPYGTPTTLRKCIVVRSDDQYPDFGICIGLEDALKINDSQQGHGVPDLASLEAGLEGLNPSLTAQTNEDETEEDEMIETDSHSMFTTKAVTDNIQELARWAEAIADLGGIPLGPINTIEWEWEVPDFIKSRDYTGDFSFSNEVIITTSSWKVGGNPGNSDQLHAWTCIEWASECLPEPWQRLVLPFLDHVASNVTHSDTGSFDFTLDRHGSLGPWASPLRWTYDQHSLQVLLAPRFPGHKPVMEERLIEFIDLVGWFCRTMRVRRAEDRISFSSSLYTVERIELLRHFNNNEIGSAADSCVFKPRMVLRDEPLQEAQHDCWRKLFDFCTVTSLPDAFHPAERHDQEDPVFGHGLEMSFDLMLALSAVELSLVIGGGVVFFGFDVAVVPTAINANGDAAQFHIITKSGKKKKPTDHDAVDIQLNPYKIDLGQRLLTDDPLQFRAMRCFLGWSEHAQVNLGTRDLPANVQYSRSVAKGRSLILDGYQGILQMGLSSPFSAVVGLQTNFRYTGHVRHFTPFGGFKGLLRRTALEVAAVYDAGKRSCWLVPKLSVLLHMAHAYVASCPGQMVDMVPFVEKHGDADELIDELDLFSEQPIHGNRSLTNNGQSTPGTQSVEHFSFRQLLFGLNTNLLSTMASIQPSKGNRLYGFEFMDIVEAPGRGTCMKAISLLPTGGHWIDIVNGADAVIVCSDIGPVITTGSMSTARNPKCNCLPTGQDLLAATVQCLTRLARRNGERLDVASSSQGIRLSDNNYWQLRGNPFQHCSHATNIVETCWKRQDLRQRLVRKSKVTARTGVAAAQAAAIPNTGAVVFG